MTKNIHTLSKNIEAIYPLAPMQQGLLFHTLMNPGQGMYLLQYQHIMTLDNLDMKAFQRAWNAVVERHELLRTSFVWKKQSSPLQIVHKSLDLPIELLDWSEFCKDKQEEKLTGLLSHEREEEFAFNKAPLMRVRLIKLAPNTYQFVRSYHHILMDAWCFSIIMMDFLNFYRAFEQGKSLSLPKPRPYRDFIAWLGEQNPKQHQEFWETQLKGFDTPTSLGIRQEGQFVQKESVADVVTLLTRAETQQIQEAAKATQVTVNTVLQGAWAFLLSQYSGDNDIVFGVTVAGRPTHMTGIESVVGLFINTLPLRVEVAFDNLLEQWLQKLQSNNLSLREHETSSLTDIQSWSEIDQQDVFQSLFVFENAPMDAGLAQENLEFIVENATNRTHTNYPITIVVIPGESLHLQITYQTSDFAQQDIEKMLVHFKKIVLDMSEQLLAESQPLNKLTMLASAENTQQQQWGTGECIDLSTDYIQHFEQQVERLPQKVAVADNKTSIDYQTLNNRVNLLANKLIGEGIGADNIVAILAERNAELLIMIMATLKAGAAYLPLDPKHPAARSAQILEQSGSTLLLASENQFELANTIKKTSTTKANILSFNLATQKLSTCKNPNVPVHPQQLAYIIFTSGSTGTPKGAMVTRKGMLNNMLGKFLPLSLGEGDIIAQTASQCFDISVWQFLIAPILGARVEILPDCISHDPVRLTQAIKQRGISILESVPALLQSILDQQQTLGSLRWVLPTGEALPPGLAKQWLQSYPAIPLMNAYGPAECSDDVAFYPIVNTFDSRISHVPIGRPTANNQLYILSPELTPMPVGTIGEIYVAGTGVGRGYSNEPRRSAAVFLPNPFANDNSNEGGRLYRTGDLGRFLSDGSIQYVGRTDYQVKVRGYRIELGEIESCIANYPSVNEVVVISLDDAQRGKVLVAYISVDSEFTENISALKAFMGNALPDYMIPSTFIVLDKLPRNSNGKVDRKQLPAVDFEEQHKIHYLAPSNDVEVTVCEIWQNLLGIQRVGIKDNFFELGGHSLLATQLAGRLSQAFAFDVPLRSIFENATITDWLNWCDNREESIQTISTKLPELKVMDKPAHLPLSFVQQRLWFLQRLEPSSASYNLSAALHLKGRGKETVDISKLCDAINTCVKRHEVLRTSFVIENDEAVQKISAFSPISIEKRLIDDSKQVSNEAALKYILKKDAMTPFALDESPLLRFGIYQLKANNSEVILSINCHHIIADAWSLHLLIEEFCHYYNDQTQKTITPDNEIQYSDYALWQRQCLHDGLFDTQLAFWKNKLAGELPTLELNYDYKRPEQPTFTGARYNIVLPDTLASQLVESDRLAKRSHFISLLGAFQLLLNAYSGQSDIIIGIPIANRHHYKTQSIIGCFINTIVHRANLLPQQTVADLLTAVEQQSIDAQANQDLPFDYLIEQLGVDRQLSYNPLFQTMFNYLSEATLDKVELNDLDVDFIDNRPDTALCDFKLDVQTNNGVFKLSFEYSTELFKEDSIASMADDFQRILHWMLANESTSKKISAIDIWQSQDLTRQQKQAQENGLSIKHMKAIGAIANNPYSGDVIADFQAQAIHEPHRLAVKGKSGELSYQELDQLTDYLANLLVENGADTHHRVAICVERDTAMIAGMLAILKLGATYIPIDSNWPAERANYILEHSSPSLCLADTVLKPFVDSLKSNITCLALENIKTHKKEATGNKPFAPRPINSLQTAYILYTSGSTGKPKGVSVNRGNINNLFVDLRHRLNLTTPQQVLGLSSYCFDISIVELLLPLTQGSSVIVANKEETRDPKKLAQLLEQCKKDNKTIDVMQATPATWSMLLANNKLPLNNTTLISCGEALSSELANKLFQLGKRLFNIYGPTEVTVFSSYKEITSTNDKPASIGVDGLNVQSYILDKNLRPVPQGVIGELYLGGANVSDGYVKQPALTATTFLPNPFSTDKGERLYKTGDLVKRNKAGEIDYIGRNDFQVKLRGFRIELGEIESQLMQLAAIDNAAVVLYKNLGESRQESDKLIAYYSGTALDSSIIRQQLLNNLPEYMVPSIFQWLETMPLNSNAKVDRKALLALPLIENQQRQDQDKNNTNIQSWWEKQLLILWQQLFNRVDITTQDDFFELGGHSLLVARFVARLQEEHAIDLPLKLVFENSVLADLAAIIEIKITELYARQEIIAHDQQEYLPMYATQQRLWFMEQFNGAGRAYQLSSAIKIAGQLDKEYLRQALELLMERQYSLRTIFGNIGGELFQSISPDSKLPLRIQQLSINESPNLNNWLEGTANQPFDLINKPAWRVDLYEIKSSEKIHYSVIQLCIHHIIADAWSLDIFIKELQQLYLHVKDTKAQVTKENTQIDQSTHAAPLQNLPFQFKDFSLWSKSEAAKEEINKDILYWKNHLQGESPVLDLPTDLPRPKQQGFKGQRHRFRLSKKLVSSLKSISSRNNITAFIPLLSAWQLLLSRHSGQKDIRVGIPVANRHRPHTQNLIAYFASTQVIKAPLIGRETVISTWKALRNTLIDAQQHQSLPFEQLVEVLNVPRNVNHSPLFQTLFNLIQLPSEENSFFAGLATERLTIEDGTSITDISLQIESTADEWHCVLEYNTDLFLVDTAQVYAQQYTTVLQQMLGDTEALIGNISPLSKANQLALIDLNKSPASSKELESRDLKEQQDFITCFERQVKEHPDNTAINYQGQAISYAALNEQSNYLAKSLLMQTIKPEQCIAVCLDRTPLLLIALIAIQKVGAAYIPLDPLQPKERLAYICGHAKPELLITETNLASILGQKNIQSIYLDTLLKAMPIDGDARKNVNSKITQAYHSNQLAYVIYTSGSTGKPKGVAVTRGNLSNFLTAMNNTLLLSSKDNWLAVTTASFDISALEFYLPLMNGASIQLASTRESMDGEQLFQLLEKSTVLQATPTTWQLLLSQNKQLWPVVRGLVGGEAVPAKLAHELLQKGVELSNVYGPTETTIWSTSKSIGNDAQDNNVVSIGSPILNTQCYVLDDNLQLVPRGATGELYIAGAGVARAYQHEAALSAGAFIPSPFNNDGSRMYKTGDLVKWNSDGELDYIGRSDFQIKIRGFRIELGEIESCIHRQVHIDEAIVVSDSQQRLIAFIKITQESTTTQDFDIPAIKQSLEKQLPAYMVPYHFIVIEQFPLNSNGKIDRKELAKIADENVQNSVEGKGRKPETETEVKLAAIWKELLNLDPSVDDSFFELGGHSLLAMQLITRVEKEFATKLALQSLFENPTIAALAEQVGNIEGKEKDADLDLMDQLLSEMEG